MVRRSKSCGIFARSSAQSVSMIPASGFSRWMVKPFSIQNSRTTGQTLSGEVFTTSQRWLPERSTRMPSTAGSTPAVEGTAGPPVRSREYVE